jgi:dTMP kinase
MYYAFDRYDTYINDIKQYMGKVDIILFDRFVNSNLFNAARMMPNVDKVLDVVEWLYKFEYELLKLPQEDISIFLRMPYEKARIIRQRLSNNKNYGS